MTPSIDAIGEFKVLTSNYGAQYGKNGSGTIEVETKSGTNKFHGDAYEFVRNNMFNSPSFLQDGVAPPYHKNDFGYTIGGPAYIPGVYNQSKSQDFLFLVAGVAPRPRPLYLRPAGTDCRGAHWKFHRYMRCNSCGALSRGLSP